MARAAEIAKAHRSFDRATREVERAARMLFVTARQTKWALACSPTPETVMAAINRALKAQNAGIAALARQQATRAALAAAWRN